MSVQKVIEAIKKHSRFLITSHIDLEGDALGSELALAALLKKMGKQVDIVNSGNIPYNYQFLPGVKKVYLAQRPKGRVAHCLINRNYQAVFILDCPDMSRASCLADIIIKDKLSVINIDHHLYNKNFGQINWVDPKASSSGEMIYRLFDRTCTKLDKADALAIYIAILTDTGSFRHANTTSAALSICSQLLKFGIKPNQVYTKIYENISLPDARYVARLISNISFAANNRIAWFKISQANFKRIKGKHEILDKILDFARSIDTVKVVIIFSQVNNQRTKISLRSKSPTDVQKVAAAFGGGGHKFASGCIIRTSLKQAEEKMLRQVKQALAIHK